MSYSLRVQKATKTDAKAAAVESLRSATNGQRAHDCDREVVATAIGGMVDALGDDSEATDVLVEAYGHVGGIWLVGALASVTEANVTIKVTRVPRP